LIDLQLEIRDDRLKKIVRTGSQLERITSGFRFIEGPVWHPYEKFLIFSDILGNCMYHWRGKEGLSTFREPSQMANGNTYDREGRLLTCEHATSRVTRTERDGRIVILASHFNGKELNSPNDIVVKSDGAIYFTDPNSGRGPLYGVAREQELSFQGVYRIHPHDQSLDLLVDDFSKPNGLCFSLDEKQLFINDTNRNHIRVFDVAEDGTLKDGGVWAETIGEGAGVPDGMKIDQEGYLYCCGPGGVYVFDGSAHGLGVIRTPEKAANFAWGDEDLCGLYITASTTLYRLRVGVPGVSLF
jgi:gluconolactonase